MGEHRNRRNHPRIKPLADFLETQIKNGKYAFGERLPTTEEIRYKYGNRFLTDPTGICEARKILVERGLVETFRGNNAKYGTTGTYVIWKGEDVET